MHVVNLASGGLDSTLIEILLKENGDYSYPLFLDYGQLAAKKEWNSCVAIHKRWSLPKPTRMSLSGFGRIISSGLTDKGKNIKEDAFTPCRNLLFVVAAAAYAFQKSADGVTIGLLSERYSLFPDQRSEFVARAEEAIFSATGRKIRILTPLANFTKSEVIAISKQRKLVGTYSCHAGGDKPCNCCISCLEVKNSKK